MNIYPDTSHLSSREQCGSLQAPKGCSTPTPVHLLIVVIIASLCLDLSLVSALHYRHKLSLAFIATSASLP